MMRLLAHSAQNGFPAQSYQDHVKNVRQRATEYAAQAEQFAADSSGQLQKVVSLAAEYHDLGKLDEKNQNALCGEGKALKKLPVNHVDAGTAYLLKLDQSAKWSAITVYSHHRGLPDFSEEKAKEKMAFRDEYTDVRARTDKTLSSLLEIHSREVKPSQPAGPDQCVGDAGVFLRLALSCIADADHSDTAESAGKGLSQDNLPNLRAKERLAALDRYVRDLEQSGEYQFNPRDSLRSEMYWHCRDAEPKNNIVSCDSPVGSGKTTAVMAHLLSQADRRGLRRIFVVLPYTNIITQTVQVYRRALTLPGENPEEVVAELHHRADFEDNDLRYLTALWRASIIVTTAVGFYETLASNKPAVLRRLHELPGSAIFVDEAHAALPVHLLSVAWHWMNVLAREWSCYWLLASGSLVRFWTLQEVIPESCTVPELVSEKLRVQLMQYESRRVRFCWEARPMSRENLIRTVMDAPGPRLLIVNTVQNAAVLSRDIAKAYGRAQVEHLSTALTPKDRAEAIERIKTRLQDPSDTNWILVATSCVEAGVDFSFHTGFREAASMVSLLQTAGRINRNGLLDEAEVWTFQMQDDPLLKRNPGVAESAAVLLRYLEEGLTPAPGLSTRAIQDELQQAASRKLDLHSKENAREFQTVAKNFFVIDSDSVPVVVDPKIAESFCSGGGDWRTLQKNSVSIPKVLLDRYGVEELKPGLYCWKLPYSSFLGYMEGVVEEVLIKSTLQHFEENGEPCYHTSKDT